MTAIIGVILLVIGALGFLDVLDMRPPLEIVFTLGGLILIVVDPKVRARL